MRATNWVRHRSKETPAFPQAIQIFVSGALVFVTGLCHGTIDRQFLGLGTLSALSQDA
jgi:hypothetical protein